jgi:pimeloyl-ACP methyl ester carboxylesterase
MSTSETRPGRRAGVLPVPGARLHYEVSGSGPGLVLIHGFALDMTMWDEQVADLEARFRVVRYDCRGFGTSAPMDPEVPYAHAEDLLALLDHLGLGQVVLAGLSFGGMVAVKTALLAPGRVRGLVLLDSAVDGMSWDEPSRAGLAELARQVQAGGVAAGRDAWLAHPLFTTARQRPDLTAQLAAMVSRFPGQHWLGQDPHRPDPRPVREVLDQLCMPALVIVGELDVPGFVAMSEELARRIPGARLVRVPGAGHMTSLERPAEISSELARFASGLEG